MAKKLKISFIGDEKENSVDENNVKDLRNADKSLIDRVYYAFHDFTHMGWLEGNSNITIPKLDKTISLPLRTLAIGAGYGLLTYIMFKIPILKSLLFSSILGTIFVISAIIALFVFSVLPKIDNKNAFIQTKLFIKDEFSQKIIDVDEKYKYVKYGSGKTEGIASFRGSVFAVFEIYGNFSKFNEDITNNMILNSTKNMFNSFKNNYVDISTSFGPMDVAENIKNFDERTQDKNVQRAINNFESLKILRDTNREIIVDYVGKEVKVIRQYLVLSSNNLQVLKDMIDLVIGGFYIGTGRAFSEVKQMNSDEVKRFFEKMSFELSL